MNYALKNHKSRRLNNNRIKNIGGVKHLEKRTLTMVEKLQHRN